MSPVQTTPRPHVMLTVFFLAVGLWQIGEGSWIHAKARLAQVLLRRAWFQTLAGELPVKPWPWADTWPVGRLRVPSQEVDVIVLNGAYGRTLAFGPAFAESSSLPGAGGTTVLTGHRDTHFAFVGRLKEWDAILIDTPDGTSLHYRVLDSAIVDARTDAIRLSVDSEELILLTCYPFDTLSSGSPLRYLIRAVPVPLTRSRSIDRPGGRESGAQEDQRRRCEHSSADDACKRLLRLGADAGGATAAGISPMVVANDVIKTGVPGRPS